MYLFQRYILLISCILCGIHASAQNHLCDSILALPVSQQHIDLLLEQTVYKKELKDYTLKALELSEETNYIHGIMHALDQLGVMERNDSHYAEALAYHNRCLALAESQQAEHWLMRSYINLGVVYRRIDAYEKALQYFLSALPVAEKLKNGKEIASCLGNIGTLYLSLNKLDEAMDYFRKSLDKAIEQNNYQGLAISYGSIGRVFERQGLLDSAQYCYEKNLFYSTGWNDDNGIAISYNCMGNIAKKSGDWNKALEYYRMALDMSLKVGDRTYIAPNYANLGEVYLHLGDKVNAEKNYLKSLQIAYDAGIKSSMALALGGLSNTYEQQNRITEALSATKLQMALKDSILNEENLRSIEHLRITFDVQQKEQTIATLQALNQIEQLKNRQKQAALLIGAGLLISLLLFIAMYVRNSRQKRMIAEQRLRQLEQEKQLVATQAVLDGETRERTRLARDLHDGLGSMLTGVKLNLLELKQGAHLEYADVERFDKAVGLLDNSVREMRRVAHHLMPDSLSRFGLKPAVTDFCNNLPLVSFAYYGDESRLEPNLEVMIYRTIHELVNNALKHAKAGKIIVQIMQDPGRIAFTVQDDGCGFDASAAVQGMGLQNIRTRVASYNGILNIDSKIGEGTEINIEL
jgi:signal transduction histidine kinase